MNFGVNLGINIPETISIIKYLNNLGKIYNLGKIKT